MAAAGSTWSRTRPRRRPTRRTQPEFEKTPDGEGISFTNSFGTSGDQSRAVEAGQQADVVHLSIEPDVTRLVDAGLVAEDWNQNEYDGIVQDSVVVFVTRPGNPKGVETWDDLVTGDVEVLTPNPFTSGGARWNLMAAYGNQTITEGKSEQEGLQFISDLLANVVGPGRERPRLAGDLPGRQGRRSARLRERGDRGPGRRRGDRVRGPGRARS